MPELAEALGDLAEPYAAFHEALAGLLPFIDTPGDPRLVEQAEAAYADTAAALAETIRELYTERGLDRVDPYLDHYLALIVGHVEREIHDFDAARTDLRAIVGQPVNAGVAEELERAYHHQAQHLAGTVNDYIRIALPTQL
jgi:hypothetical protein